MDQGHFRATKGMPGRTGLPVFPTKTSTPEPNWSHLDHFRKKRMTEGLARLSTTNKLLGRKLQRKLLGSGRDCNFTKTKESEKHTVAAAHISKRSWLTPVSSQTFFMPLTCRIENVIGRQILAALALEWLWRRWIPIKTSFRRGNEDVSRGSGKLNEIWRLGIAARYSHHRRSDQKLHWDVCNDGGVVPYLCPLYAASRRRRISLVLLPCMHDSGGQPGTPVPSESIVFDVAMIPEGLSIAEVCHVGDEVGRLWYQFRFPGPSCMRRYQQLSVLPKAHPAPHKSTSWSVKICDTQVTWEGHIYTIKSSM